MVLNAVRGVVEDKYDDVTSECRAWSRKQRTADFNGVACLRWLVSLLAHNGLAPASSAGRLSAAHAVLVHYHILQFLNFISRKTTKRHTIVGEEHIQVLLRWIPRPDLYDDDVQLEDQLRRADGRHVDSEKTHEVAAAALDYFGENNIYEHALIWRLVSEFALERRHSPSVSDRVAAFTSVMYCIEHCHESMQKDSGIGTLRRLTEDWLLPSAGVGQPVPTAETKQQALVRTWALRTLMETLRVCEDDALRGELRVVLARNVAAYLATLAAHPAWTTVLTQCCNAFLSLARDDGLDDTDSDEADDDDDDDESDSSSSSGESFSSDVEESSRPDETPRAAMTAAAPEAASAKEADKAPQGKKECVIIALEALATWAHVIVDGPCPLTPTDASATPSATARDDEPLPYCLRYPHRADLFTLYFKVIGTLIEITASQEWDLDEAVTRALLQVCRASCPSPLAAWLTGHVIDAPDVTNIGDGAVAIERMRLATRQVGVVLQVRTKLIDTIVVRYYPPPGKKGTAMPFTEAVANADFWTLHAETTAADALILSKVVAKLYRWKHLTDGGNVWTFHEAGLAEAPAIVRQQWMPMSSRAALHEALVIMVQAVNGCRELCERLKKRMIRAWATAANHGDNEPLLRQEVTNFYAIRDRLHTLCEGLLTGLNLLGSHISRRPPRWRGVEKEGTSSSDDDDDDDNDSQSIWSGTTESADESEENFPLAQYFDAVGDVVVDVANLHALEDEEAPMRAAVFPAPVVGEPANAAGEPPAWCHVVTGQTLTVVELSESLFATPHENERTMRASLSTLEGLCENMVSMVEQERKRRDRLGRERAEWDIEPLCKAPKDIPDALHCLPAVLMRRCHGPLSNVARKAIRRVIEDCSSELLIGLFDFLSAFLRAVHDAGLVPPVLRPTPPPELPEPATFEQCYEFVCSSQEPFPNTLVDVYLLNEITSRRYGLSLGRLKQLDDMPIKDGSSEDEDSSADGSSEDEDEAEETERNGGAPAGAITLRSRARLANREERLQGSLTDCVAAACVALPLFYARHIHNNPAYADLWQESMTRYHQSIATPGRPLSTFNFVAWQVAGIYCDALEHGAPKIRSMACSDCARLFIQSSQVGVERGLLHTGPFGLGLVARALLLAPASAPRQPINDFADASIDALIGLLAPKTTAPAAAVATRGRGKAAAAKRSMKPQIPIETIANALTASIDVVNLVCPPIAASMEADASRAARCRELLQACVPHLPCTGDKQEAYRIHFYWSYWAAHRHPLIYDSVAQALFPWATTGLLRLKAERKCLLPAAWRCLRLALATPPLGQLAVIASAAASPTSSGAA